MPDLFRPCKQKSFAAQNHFSSSFLRRSTPGSQTLRQQKPNKNRPYRGKKTQTTKTSGVKKTKRMFSNCTKTTEKNEKTDPAPRGLCPLAKAKPTKTKNRLGLKPPRMATFVVRPWRTSRTWLEIRRWVKRVS